MNCFQLLNKTTGEPANLNDVDAEICAMLNTPVDPEHFVHYWYEIIGLAAACGHSFEKMRNEIFVDADPTALQIINYLDEHYTIRCWAQPRCN